MHPWMLTLGLEGASRGHADLAALPFLEIDNVVLDVCMCGDVDRACNALRETLELCFCRAYMRIVYISSPLEGAKPTRCTMCGHRSRLHRSESHSLQGGLWMKSLCGLRGCFDQDLCSQHCALPGVRICRPWPRTQARRFRQGDAEEAVLRHKIGRTSHRVDPLAGAAQTPGRYRRPAYLHDILGRRQWQVRAG